MIRVNDFLADFEAHHAPPSNLKISDCAARAGLWELSEDAGLRRSPYLVSSLSLASYLANGQGSMSFRFAFIRVNPRLKLLLEKVVSECFAGLQFECVLFCRGVAAELRACGCGFRKTQFS